MFVNDIYIYQPLYSEFSFSKTGCPTKTKELSLP